MESSDPYYPCDIRVYMYYDGYIPSSAELASRRLLTPLVVDILLVPSVPCEE
jgi:hypothetical protein